MSEGMGLKEALKETFSGSSLIIAEGAAKLAQITAEDAAKLDRLLEILQKKGVLSEEELQEIGEAGFQASLSALSAFVETVSSS